MHSEYSKYIILKNNNNKDTSCKTCKNAKYKKTNTYL